MVLVQHLNQTGHGWAGSGFVGWFAILGQPVKLLTALAKTTIACPWAAGEAGTRGGARSCVLKRF